MALHNLNLTYKESYLTPEQFNQLLKILQDKPFIRPSIVYELKDDKLLKEKFDVPTGKLVADNDRKVLGKILKSIRQE